jgi:hypothetical protein
MIRSTRTGFLAAAFGGGSFARMVSGTGSKAGGADGD